MAQPTSFRDAFHLEAAGDDTFQASLEDHGGVSFGGDVFALATLAAGRTCPERATHSLHVHFLRPVPPGVPVDFQVERTRDGRRIAHRRVSVSYEGRLLSQVVASFAAETPGPDFTTVPFDPPTPPESLPSEAETARHERWEPYEPGITEWRWPELPFNTPAGTPSRYQAWARPTEPIPDDPGLHAAALAYLSDFHSHIPVARVLGGAFEPSGYASLDIVVWLHRPVRWEGYWLVTSVADLGHGGRALTRRHVHDRTGALIATMMQEAIIPAD